MPSVHQLRGVLLEEAILALLRAGGYRTVSEVGDDPMLSMSGAGLRVRGRGAHHQIDAIADLRVGQPFSNPQRLLVEAKCYSDRRLIRLPIVRNAVGVLKDVSEYWVGHQPDSPGTARYHYQSAIFSSSEFTADAQAYAFAHDIHLLPLSGSSYFAPVIDAINRSTAAIVPARGITVDVVLGDVRQEVRKRFQPRLATIGITAVDAMPWLDPIVAETMRVGRSLIAILGRAFPVFLTPRPSLNLDEMSPVTEVEIHFDDAQERRGWAISSVDGDRMFTFDLPRRLFRLYADEGALSRRQAVNLKQEYLGEFSAIYASDDAIKILTFRLSPAWLENLRRGLD